MGDSTAELIADMAALISRCAPYDADWPDLRDRIDAWHGFAEEHPPVRLAPRQVSLIASLVRGAQKDVERMAAEKPWMDWAWVRVQLLELLDALGQDEGGEF